MNEWTIGYRIVPDGRIDPKPVSRKHLANCMRLASVLEDAVTELNRGGIVYVDSMHLAEKIVCLAGLTNWGIIEEGEGGNG